MLQGYKGQSLGSALAACNSWYNEINDYSFKMHTGRPGTKVARFTQVKTLVWSNFGVSSNPITTCLKLPAE